ncbi:hypothetical protein [Rahnella aceris]|nr:hypothetical protein [Rahnella aceris]
MRYNMPVATEIIEREYLREYFVNACRITRK